MTTLVIGGDRIDSIRRELADHGLDEIEHWGGRKPADARPAIPAVPGWTNAFDLNDTCPQAPQLYDPLGRHPGREGFTLFPCVN
jgi:hypothetical protein